MPFIDYIPSPVENCELEPIAICGMGCRLPGKVDSSSSLWDLLIRKGSGNSEQVPRSRFNIDAHFHKNLERPGSLNVRGGYFLDGPAENFDPTFFNLSPVEAMWLDPQQRKMLEVCYEAIESSGLTIDSISGTNTAVFIGSFTADYQQMTFKEPDFRHSYAATGVDPGIISNRISNVFNLKGPSFTINTACSSSVYALHNACHALRAKDCEGAFVGGVNLILTVDQHMNTAKLGVLSPTSFCHTFDASADGYGRGEGVGCLYLKRLHDAVRDGNVIRGVIRSSAVNTNGKVPGYGITYPNIRGQEEAIRKAYERAKLDPNKTAYFECHGTGTSVGDPIEVRAVSNAMNDSRALDKPLLIGSIKPNIGHSEAASGIFAVMKAALVTETGIIPGVAGLKNINPEIPEAMLNIKVNKDTALWPQGFEPRRASVSSFGYGGTNGHVILEEVRSLVPHYQHGTRKNMASSDRASSRPLLVTLSAHDKATLARNIEAHAKVASQYYLVDFAHTLNLKRTRFSQRAFTIASEDSVTQDMSMANFKMGSSNKCMNQIAFIFTGQGAQWAGVGKDAIKTFPVFRETIRKLDRVLKHIDHPPKFSIEQELIAPMETSRIHTPYVSQATLVATQIAIVDLLSSWNIVPLATVGHSAGEYAAAYAAGIVSAPEIIIAAYYRGYALENYAPSGGTMLFVGKGIDEIGPYLSRFDENIVVACENSPNSVTLSGMTAAIQEAKSVFESESIFVRLLETGMAYHSPHMETVAGPMVELVERAYKKLDFIDWQWRCSTKTMVSSVTNASFHETSQINPDYWASNLISRVRFDTALSTLVKTVGQENIGGFIEIGPHSALAGSFKQICQVNGFDLAYIPTLLRNKDGAHSLLKTAGELFLMNYPVRLDYVNQLETSWNTLDFKSPRVQPLTLVDLPPYQWNYKKVFWAEPRISAEHRNPSHPRHDILGSRIPGLSHRSMVWRNILRLKDIPWLQDHKLGGSIMFPASGHMALAIEAALQHCENSKLDVTGMTLRNVEFKAALVIPNTDAGLEIQLRLSQTSLSSSSNPSYSFSVESYSNDAWTVHSEGSIVPIISNENQSTPPSHPVNLSALTQRHKGTRWNDSFRRVGFEYGPSFGLLDNIRTNRKFYQAGGQIPISIASTSMIDESRYILHPSTVDCLLQLCIISIHAGQYQDMPWGVIPIKSEELSFFFPGDDAGSLGQAVAWNPVRGGRARNFSTNSQLLTEAGKVILDIKGLHTVAYEAALPQQNEFKAKPLPYAGVVWKPDLAICPLKETISTYAKGETPLDAIYAIIALSSHKLPLSSILVVDSSQELAISQILCNLHATTNLNFARSCEGSLPEDERIQKLKLQENIKGLGLLRLDSQDLVICGSQDGPSLFNFEWLSLLSENGKAIFLLDHDALSQAREKIAKTGCSSDEIPFGDQTLVICSLSTATDGDAEEPKTVQLVYSRHHSDKPQALAEVIAEQGMIVEVKEIADVNPANDKQICLYDPSGNILAHLEQTSFEVVKELISSDTSLLWLTCGVNAGKCTAGAMVSGFLRVAREEQKMSKLTQLDFDATETCLSIATTIKAIFGESDRCAGSIVEHEYWLQKGACHVSRVIPNEELNARMNADESAVLEMLLPRGQSLQVALIDSDLVFSQSDTSADLALNADEVEIQVENLEFSKHDLQTEVEGPRLISGTVIHTGHAIDKRLTGKMVVAFVNDPFTTILKVPEAMCVECEANEAQALVYCLPDLCRAANALSWTRTTTRNQHVILLPTSEPIIRSFVKLSETQGFRLTIICDNADDIDDKIYQNSGKMIALLRTSEVAQINNLMNQEGSAVTVVAHDFSPFSQQIWSGVPSGGSFVLNENKNKALSVAPDFNPLNRGAHFFVTTLASTFQNNPLSLRKTLQTLSTIMRDQICIFESETVASVKTIQTASNTSMAGSVLTYNYETDLVKIIPSEYQLHFSSEDVYLLVGCLGGLGRSLTAWMMERGAKHFAFISRSGADKPEAAQLIESIEKAGAITQVFRGDASKIEHVSSVIEKVSVERRINGVVHAAMVLEDAMLGPNMTIDKFKAALVPKVDGAQALHTALQGHDLDFFVMTSSISATVGQPGQSNYAAANSFLDNLAWQRNLAGLPATSLVLPMVLGVGVVAENSLLEDKISRRGMYGIDEGEMLRAFEAAMSQPTRKLHHSGSSSAPTQRDSAIILGLDPSRLAAALASADKITDIAWSEDARFSHLRPLIDLAAGKSSKTHPSRSSSSSTGGSSSSPSSFIEVASTAATTDGLAPALELTISHIMHKCASILMITDLSTFDRDRAAGGGGQSISSFGLDSMVGAELRNWLFKELGLKIAFQDLLAPTLTFGALAEMVLRNLNLGLGG